jgi:hypothetical protein
VKIEGTCRRCGRGFLVTQVIENGGRCPWDGQPFQPDYAVVLADALRQAEVAGDVLEAALDKIADLAPAFELDVGSVLEALRRPLERLAGTPQQA